MADTVYEVTVGERVVRVALRRSPDGLFARIDDGEARPVRLDTVRGPLRSLALADARTELLAARERDNGVRITLHGIAYQAEVVDEAHARLASVAGTRQTISKRFELKAPMPGLVVKILCEVGDEVAAGTPLAVLQAMKMENELALPHGGSIRAIAVDPGQTVEQNQVLLVVE